MTDKESEEDDKSLKTILIVEDEPLALEACETFLTQKGFSVMAALEAREAIKLASESPPEIIICDWRLSGSKTGVDVARELQSMFDVDVIFTSAYPLDELRSASSDLDVHCYLRKPISLKDLTDAIKSIQKESPGEDT